MQREPRGREITPHEGVAMDAARDEDLAARDEDLR